MRVSGLFFLVAMLPATASFSLGVAPATGRVVAASQSQPAAVLRVTPMMVEAKEDGEDKENMMQQVKDAGVAGIISYVFWEWAFWGVSGNCPLELGTHRSADPLIPCLRLLLCQFPCASLATVRCDTTQISPG